MNIPHSKSVTSNARRPRKAPEHFDGYTISEKQIKRFATNPRHLNIGALMYGVPDAANTPPNEAPGESPLKPARTPARIKRNKGYRTIMKAVVAAAEPRTAEGIYAAGKTERRAMEIASEYSPGDEELRGRYKHLYKRPIWDRQT